VFDVEGLLLNRRVCFPSGGILLRRGSRLEKGVYNLVEDEGTLVVRGG